MSSAPGAKRKGTDHRITGEWGGSYHGGWIGAVVARSGSCAGGTQACNWGQIRTEIAYRGFGVVGSALREWKGSAYLVGGCSLPAAKGPTKRSPPLAHRRRRE